MLFSLSARQHNVIMRVFGVDVTMHHVIMVAIAPKCMFDVIVVVGVNIMHAIVVGHRKRLSDRTPGTVKERVVQVHLPAPMGTCVPLTGGISKTGGVCSENKTR